MSDIERQEEQEQEEDDEGKEELTIARPKESECRYHVPCMLPTEF
jgi:hypothetical protein